MKKLLTGFLIAVTAMACNDNSEKMNDGSAERNDTITVKENDAMSAAEKQTVDFHELDWNSPVVKYDEVDDEMVNIRSRNNYAIYSIDEDRIFKKDTTLFDANGQKILDRIAASINKRYQSGDVRIYNATYEDAWKKSLASRRATVVRDYLSNNGGIAASRISYMESGEVPPAGQNSRTGKDKIEIVVLTR